MVSSALLQQSNLAAESRDGFLASLSRLAAIASIADCVPLSGATRTLTRLGLAELSKTTHAGILASRARERFGVPTFVLVHDPSTGMAVGSGRSIEGISLIDALRSCKDVLHRYGGHQQAAGVTVAVEAVPAFRKALLRYVEEHPAPRETQPSHDADLELCTATSGFYDQLRAMEPFGIGNPVPVFRVHAASVHARTEKFVTVRQGPHELKVRAIGRVGKEELGTALIALNGSSATW